MKPMVVFDEPSLLPYRSDAVSPEEVAAAASRAAEAHDRARAIARHAYRGVKRARNEDGKPTDIVAVGPNLLPAWRDPDGRNVVVRAPSLGPNRQQRRRMAAEARIAARKPRPIEKPKPEETT